MSELSAYASKLAAVAEDQHSQFHLQHESDHGLSRQIKKYWTQLGFDFPGTSTPWSAIFVSWCVRTAGAADDEFKFAPAHAKFVHWAIQNSINQVNLFRGHDISSYAPNVGDIIQNNRNGHNFNFDHAKSHSAYESHSAIVIETGQDNQGKYLLTVGGNESDTVGMKLIRLHADGKIKQRTNSSFICVIQNLK